MSDFDKVRRRLEVLCGVCFGLVSSGDVANIAGLLGISGERIPELIAYLNRHGIDIISEEQKAKLLSGKIDYSTHTDTNRSETGTPDYWKYDEALDKLLESDIEKGTLENWLGRLYRCRRNGIGTIVFMKLAGIAAKDISAILEIPIERVYYFEQRILQHYRYTRQNLAHQRLWCAKRQRILDYYE